MNNNHDDQEREKQVETPIKLFCADNTPLQTANFIFDKTYKNMNQKKRFENDPKFAYFNTLTKLKNSFRQSNKDVYSFLFHPKTDNDEHSNSIFQNQELTPKQRQIFTRQLAPRQTFHVQKINNHAFKIYKTNSKKVSRSSTFSAITNAQSISDINFHVHYKNRNKQKEQKPKIQILLSQYRKIQMMKARGNPQKQKQVIVEKSQEKSRVNNFMRNTSRSFKNNSFNNRVQSVPHRKSSLFMTSSKIGRGKGRGAVDLSELALKISN